jgi:hypothetical protein
VHHGVCLMLLRDHMGPWCFVGSMLVISLLLCYVFFVLFVFVLCLVDSASGLVLRFSLTFIQSPSIDLLVLLTRSLVAA